MADTDKNTKSAESETQEESVSEELLKEWTAEAENGSISHQVMVASHYLKLAEVGIDQENNGEKAVSWFIKASQRGDEAATEKLRHCILTNIGVTESNKSEALWCLNTSSSEKRVRHAAKSLFSRLGGGQNGAISKAEYVDAINSLTAGHEKERKILLAAGKKIGDTITENDFVKTISKKIQGTLTLTADETGETSAAYNASSPVRKVLVYPKETAKILFDRSLEYASKEGLNLIMALIPTNQIYLLAMVFAYSYLKAELFLLVVPLMVFFISYLVLVVSTLQMFYKHRKQKDASTLASLLQNQFDTNIDIQSTESQYSWNSLTPYYVFFGTLPILVLSFSFANQAYIPCAEMVVVAIAMTAVCFFGLSDSHDILTLVALALHAFSALPILIANSQNTFLLKAVSFVARPLFSIYLGFGISFNLSLPSIVHMLIPFLFLRLAVRVGWSGLLKTLVPHLVCYCWFSFVIVIFPFTTWFSLARATIGYLLLPIFVPASLLVIVFGFFYLFYKLLQTEMIGKLLVTALLIAVPILLTQTKTLFGTKKKAESPKAKKVKKIVMIVFSVAAVLPLLFVRVPSVLNTKKLELSQEDYQNLCVAGENELIAPYQIRCHDFIGTHVNWTGQVNQVTLVQVENTVESVFKTLPSLVAQPLFCIYGDPLPDCNEETMSKKEFRHCQLLSDTGNSCHLHRHDIISFNLMLFVGNGSLSITVEASSNFRARLLALEPGDEVQFSGKLLDTGTRSPKVKLRSLKSISRQLAEMEDMENVDILDEDRLFKMATDGVNMIFNFGLFPVFSFSPDV